MTHGVFLNYKIERPGFFDEEEKLSAVSSTYIPIKECAVENTNDKIDYLNKCKKSLMNTAIPN